MRKSSTIKAIMLMLLLVIGLLSGGLIFADDGGGSGIAIATGSGVTDLPEVTGPYYYITDYGAVSGGDALTNQAAIDDAITAANSAGGGTVVVPSGDFKTYTIHLKSNVGLHLESEDSIIRAAVSERTYYWGSFYWINENNDGGNYDAPEVNLYVGLQDHGHSHFANSLIYGNGVDNVMISGPGMIDGSYINGEGVVVNVLSGNDPGEVSTRTVAGDAGNANKAIALKDCTNITFRDFTIKNGGHFAVIGTAVIGWTIDGVLMDGNRDQLDVDQCQNVTIRNSVFNSLTDDAIVLKASFGAGRFLPCQNVLIENCTVSGYDAGSVIDQVYSTQKVVATDQCGPTARIKLGTEGTCGFNTVTVRNCTFDRSRGFCIEEVDGAEIYDISLSDCTMKNVSSSPIFIRLGDRGRTPVTGISSSEVVTPDDNTTVRKDDRKFVLPNLTDKYGNYPPMRYIPSYDRSTTVTINGGSTISIVNPNNPTKLNSAAIYPDNPYYANAVGAGWATVKNIEIKNVTVTNADPRYPITIAGLVDCPIENVTLSNISVEYRGGLKMEHAVEQRQLNQSYSYAAYESAEATQTLPWLVNTFFSKNECLLPRISWNPATNNGAGGWEDDPYNIPEMPRVYPESSLFGILPAYGIYARHVKGLTVDNMDITFKTEDERPAVVLDDVDTATFTGFTADVADGVPTFVAVTNTKKRTADCEYVLEHPYTTTTVSNLTVPDGMEVNEVTVDRPAPGTPTDSLYTYPTAPSDTYPYSYTVSNGNYPKPTTVFAGELAISDASVSEGNSGTSSLNFTVSLSNPAGKAVTVDYTVMNGIALAADNDFQPISGTLSFAATETSKTISIPVIGDSLTESDETLYVKLSNPANAVINRNQGTGTIINDDADLAAPVLNPTPGTYNTEQSITMSSTDSGVKIRYTTDGTTPTSSSALYEKPILVDVTTKVYAKAFMSGHTQSATSGGIYTINGSASAYQGSDDGTTADDMKTAYNYRNDLGVTFDSDTIRLGRGEGGRYADVWLIFPKFIGSNSGQIASGTKIASAKLTLTVKENSGNLYRLRGMDLFAITDPNGLGTPIFGATGVRNGLDFTYRDHRPGSNVRWGSNTTSILDLFTNVEPEDSYQYLPSVSTAEGYDQIVFDVTDSVQAWLDGTTANQGWFLTVDSDLEWLPGDEVALYGSAAATVANRPQLKIVAVSDDTDNVPPAAITDLAATTSNQQVVLTWTNPVSDFSGVRIVRKIGAVPYDSSDGTLVYEGTAATCQDQGLTNGVRYYYAAFSHDDLRNYAKRTWIEAVPSDGTDLPTAPSGFMATLSGTTIQFNWSDQSNNEEWFVIEGREAAADGEKEATWQELLAPTADTTMTSVALNDLKLEWKPLTTYEFRIKAVNYSGDSEYYTNATNTINTPDIPLAPADLSAAIVSAGRVNLTWTDQATNESAYRVDVCDAGHTVLWTVDLAADTSAYSVTGLTVGSDYIIKVTAVNNIGENTASSELITTGTDFKGGLL
jgi:polygalacturonase